MQLLLMQHFCWWKRGLHSHAARLWRLSWVILAMPNRATVCVWVRKQALASAGLLSW